MNLRNSFPFDSDNLGTEFTIEKFYKINFSKHKRDLHSLKNEMNFGPEH